MKFSRIFSLLFIIASISCFPSLLKAQDPGGDPDISVPFDAGLSLMVAAGIGYAIKKRHDNKKKEIQPNTKENTNL